MTHPASRGVWSCFFSFFILLGVAATSPAQDELPPEIDADGVQTLTRGPVHEAFASPTVADPKPGLAIPKRPPEDIREQPPEFQPEGQNVQWFPGYWAWDEDRDDFIWISGAWRDPPPGKRWVPGYWAEVTSGFQWVAGFWIDDSVEEMEYLKPPPDSLEQGPSVASPGDNYFYVPGTWTYTNNDYVWNTGYYAPYREDWIYVQPHWVWTPRGCVFVAGYWDWRLPRRGQIFAPIYAAPVVYQRPNYFYTPRCVINTGNLFVHLWVRDSYSHYYFGNYYGPTYANRQFTPWCNYNTRPRCYDPLFTYCNVHYHRQGINYSQRMQSWHTHYVNHSNERPPSTWRDQVDRQRHDLDNRRPGQIDNHNHFLASDLKDVIHTPDKHWKKQDVASRDLNKSSIDQIKQLHKSRFEQEKVSLVNRDVPGRDFPGRDVPGRDNPGRDNPGRDNNDRDNDRDGRNDRPRIPGVVDNDKNPDLKLPGSKPGRESPADKIAATQQALAGKMKLPKSTVSSLTAGKSKVEVPAMPDRSTVVRPTGRPDVLDKTVEQPRDFSRDRENNPLTKTGRPNVGPKVPDLNPPGNPSGVGADVVDEPRRNPTRPEGTRGGDKNPLTLRDPVEPKKPEIGGNTNPPQTDPAQSSVQQKIDAIRQQQQDALNKARGRTNEAAGPRPNPTFGVTPKTDIPKTDVLNPTPRVEKPRTVIPRTEIPRTETPRVQTPKVETPRVDIPRVETPKRDTTPRNFGGGVGGGVGGSREPKVESTPRSFTPSVQPRNSTPSVQPRSFTPPTVERTAKPIVERPQVQRPSVQPPQITPRTSPPRTNPRPENNGGGAGSGNDKKRGR